jgi:hypothetical protein
MSDRAKQETFPADSWHGQRAARGLRACHRGARVHEVRASQNVRAAARRRLAARTVVTLVRNLRGKRSHMSPPPICIRFDDLARATIRARGPARLVQTVAQWGAELRFTAEPVTAGPGPLASWTILDAAAWSEDAFDLASLDEQVCRRAAAAGSSESPVRILIRAARRPPGRPLTAHRLLGVTRQVLTRYQRFFQSRNAASAAPAFDRALALHERLHDRRKPLVAADFDHALDTWRWTLRLDPETSFAVQVAALFHDVERLDTEADARVEHLAPDYARFKAAHAAAGARRVADLLAQIDVSPGDARRICDLVEHHERGGADSKVAGAPPRELPSAGGFDDDDDPSDNRRLLAEADALSFFSLNAAGFLRYYGPDHTARKVAYSLQRLGPAGRRELRRLKVPGPIRAALATLERDQPSLPDDPDDRDETNDLTDTNVGETSAPGDSENEGLPSNELNAAGRASLLGATSATVERRPS